MVADNIAQYGRTPTRSQSGSLPRLLFTLTLCICCTENPQDRLPARPPQEKRRVKALRRGVQVRFHVSGRASSSSSLPGVTDRAADFTLPAIDRGKGAMCYVPNSLNRKSLRHRPRGQERAVVAGGTGAVVAVKEDESLPPRGAQ